MKEKKLKVRLYTGALRFVEKSGVGRALHHQEEMLRCMGVETVYGNDREAKFVHINTVFPDSAWVAILARLRGQKVVWYGHSTMEDFQNSFRFSNLMAPVFKQWIKFCYSLGDVVITPTEYSKNLLLGYGIKRPIYVISNGIDCDAGCSDTVHRSEFRKKYGLHDSEKAVMSVGHYIRRKGILEFIALARKMPDVRFFWFGYTNMRLIPREIRKAIRTAPANLCFPGYVDREELREAYSGCDLFCFLSYEETEGIVVLEALAAEIPILLRNIPVYSDWLQDGVNVYKAKTEEDVCEKMMKILSGQAADLTEEGRRTAQNRSMRKMGEKLLHVYRKLEEKHILEDYVGIN